MNIIEAKIQDAAKSILHKNFVNIQIHNSGAYSHVYKAEDEKTGIEIVIKVYLKNGFMKQEIRELEELRKYSNIAIPQVYGYLLGDDDSTDMFFMEAMSGIPVRYIKFETEAEREKIANAVVDAHIGIHNVINPDGFGDLDCESYSQSWEELYKSRIDKYYNNITTMKDSLLTDKARTYIDEAYYSYESVFITPVKKASLIHGDFKLKNILIDPKTYKLTAMFDPMGCCYGDRESDLFPYINHPEDTKFKLLYNYVSKVQLSDNFLLKNLYYFLWNEVKLYVYMGYCMNEAYEKIGENLHDMLKYGL